MAQVNVYIVRSQPGQYLTCIQQHATSKDKVKFDTSSAVAG